MAYYYIEGRKMLAKGGTSYTGTKWIMEKDGSWVKDTDSIVNDYLAGFDSSEEEGSPYRFGNGAIMREIRKVSAKKFAELATKLYGIKFDENI